MSGSSQRRQQPPSASGGSAGRRSGGRRSRRGSADSESGDETLPRSDERKPGWFDRFRTRVRMPRLRFWRTGPTGLSVKVEEALQSMTWRVNPLATVDDVKAMAIADAPIPQLIVTLQQQFFWKPGEGEDFAIAAVLSELESASEEFVKGWVLIKINERDKEQERVVVLTDAAYYTAKYVYATNRVSKVVRHALSDVYRIRTGLLIGAKWTLSGTIRRNMLERTRERQHYGLVLSLLDPSRSKRSFGRRARGATDLSVTSAGARSAGSSTTAGSAVGADGTPVVGLYERAFRASSASNQVAQEDLMNEVAWSIYLVARKLTAPRVLEEPLINDTLYRPSNFGTDTYTLAYNILGLGKVGTTAKVEAAEQRRREQAVEQERARIAEERKKIEEERLRLEKEKEELARHRRADSRVSESMDFE